MILHCVFCDLRADLGENALPALSGVLTDLEAFSLTLDGVRGFEAGPNRDFEGKSTSYDAGFVIRFADRTALEAYAIHPTHQALGARLVDLCCGGAAGIVVYDLEIGCEIG